MFYGYGGMEKSSYSADVKAGQARSAASRAESAVQRMDHEIERLLMICEAMWSILKEQYGYDDKELIKRVMEIDMRDGRLDGKAPRSEPGECRECSRKLSKRHVRCIYCGTLNAPELFGR